MSYSYHAERLMRKARAAFNVSRGTPPDPLDCGRIPVFGPSLPIKMGAGGWPIEEPTQQELEFFLVLLKKVPREYFCGFPSDVDPPTRYTAAIKVQQWLELINESKLLGRE